MQGVAERFEYGEGLRGGDDDRAVVGLRSRLNVLDGIPGDELMPLADFIDPVHQPRDFAHGSPGEVRPTLRAPGRDKCGPGRRML